MDEKKEIVRVENKAVGFDTLEGWDALCKMAQLIATADVLPAAYKAKPANCLIALNMANRMHADPLMIMQNLYSVHGNPSWSSKFLIATFNTCGRYTAIRYEMTGEKNKDSWGCRAWAVEKETGEKLVGAEITIDIAKKEGWYDKKDKAGNYCSKWRTMPELLLQYRAAAFFIRTYAPELSLGLMTKEEVIDMEQVDDGSFSAVKDKINTQQATTTIDIAEIKEEEKQTVTKEEKPKNKDKKVETSPSDEETPF